MKRAVGIVAGGLLGLSVIGGAGSLLVESLQLSEAEQHRSIEACAQALGESAITLTAPNQGRPEACEYFDFKYQQPSADAFRAFEVANIQTDASQSRFKNVGRSLFAAVGLFGGAMIGNSAVGLSRHRKQHAYSGIVGRENL